MNCTSCLEPSRCFFFFNDTATTEIYTLSLHDALPICRLGGRRLGGRRLGGRRLGGRHLGRSEEHTSELQSRQYLVCRLLLEKKKKISRHPDPHRQCPADAPRPD